ncbi:tetratricopeptide repeat protein [Candidatus Magnetominusculus xianensis]|uniref:Tetratricopeptide TPR_2 repeat protein n=1 Tax=Candidatus Magnetominusculus xianensis TaxID=1748249 RepID=A0ABR5SER5_9BACT|nr:tetratricopeptide repeat protein [Candidatus Magnetominusculus xianensis]KWT83447.1 tetratricopeptide TPR_2 repeat protein [Candidatus Magnetominusculus xianensis]MBF0405091.1 tetratricopeptide repeat protein [Nitrospirota bacterium]
MEENKKSRKLLQATDVIIIIITLITALSYAGVLKNAFITVYDDNAYVTKNAHVLGGLSVEGIRRAFIVFNDGNWFPLTWISHMTDVSLFGLNPAGHHLTSVIIHILNSALLFIVFTRMTACHWRSGFVAALFALHPLHVESVAWIAERKDVLSGFFWMLTMLTYLRYVERPGALRYVLTLASFICGLMSKPMVVTLPFVLLLMDYWPLGRVWHGGQTNHQCSSASLKRLIVEKIPFFVLSAASSVLTYHVQKTWGAVVSSDILPLKSRIANALISYFKYVIMMFNPSKSAVIYPIDERFQVWQVVGAAVFFISITAAAIIFIKRLPYLFTGWFWYAGTLVPVIGIVQVGTAAMADRYTYISFIGLFMILSMVIPNTVVNTRAGRAITAALACAVIIASACYTNKHVKYWHNSITLFERAISVTKENFVAHNHLGAALTDAGRYNEAYIQYTKALQFNYIYVAAHVNFGHLLIYLNRINEAIESYNRAITINPSYASAYHGIGVALLYQNKTTEAIPFLRMAVALNPNLVSARQNLERAMNRLINENNPAATMLMPH